MSARVSSVTLTDVRRARDRVASRIRRTPVIDVDLGDGRTAVLKLEQLQVTGSFKARGATNAVLALSEEQRHAGVVTASGGNHGQALAWAATAAGTDAVVVVPTSSPDLKAERIVGFGGTVVRHGEIYDDAAARAHQLAAETGRTFVHAFGDPAVVAGQGTVGLEMLEQVPDADALVVAIGGGGLIAGVAVAASEGGPPVVGVEPSGAPTLTAAVAAGGVPVDVAVDTATASSLGARRTTELNAALVAEHVRKIVLVDDDDAVAARDWLWEELRVVAELGGCVGLAAVLTGAVDARRPCVLVCGGNDPWTPPAVR